MQKRLLLGIALLAMLTSPFWFFVLRNAVAASQLKIELGNVSLPVGAKIISSFSLVYNSGNSDGCDYQAIAKVEHFGRVDALQSSYLDLNGTTSDEKPLLGQTDSPARWSAKLSGSSTEIDITPNIDHAMRYMVTATTYARSVSPDFRCW